MTLRDFIKKISGTRFAYRCIRALFRLPKRIIRHLVKILTTKRRRIFEQSIKQWNFNQEFSKLVDLARTNPIDFEDIIKNIINEDRFNANQLWNFQFTVDYRMDEEMTFIRAYLYDKDGKNLQPKEFSLTEVIEDTHRLVDNWYQNIKSRA